MSDTNSFINNYITGVKKEIESENKAAITRQTEYLNISRQKTVDLFVDTILMAIKESLKKGDYTSVGAKKRIAFIVGFKGYRVSYGVTFMEDGTEHTVDLPRVVGEYKVYTVPSVIIDGKEDLAPFGRTVKSIERVKNFWGKPLYDRTPTHITVSEEAVHRFNMVKAALNQKGICCSFGMIVSDKGYRFVEDTTYTSIGNSHVTGDPSIKVWCDFD